MSATPSPDASWVAPFVARDHDATVGAEEPSLVGWLDWQRATLLVKCAGLTGEQLARATVPPSSLSLLGLVRHLTDVERNWFRRLFRGEDVPDLYRTSDHPRGAFDLVDPRHAAADVERLHQEWAYSRAAVAGASLDDEFTLATLGTLNLRWIYVHLIEEYARHNGHADLLRECLDGATGT